MLGLVRAASGSGALVAKDDASHGAIGATGMSSKWIARKNNHVAVYEAFLEQVEKNPVNFEDVSQDVLIDKGTWERYSHFLFEVYEKRSKKGGGTDHISCSTAINYMNGALQKARELYVPDTDSARVFFSCLDTDCTVTGPCPRPLRAGAAPQARARDV